MADNKDQYTLLYLIPLRYSQTHTTFHYFEINSFLRMNTLT